MCPCKKMSWLSRVTMLLFSALGLWYTLKPFRVPTHGEFWHWVTLLFGVYIMIYCANQSHEQTVRFARWIGFVIFIVGAWFLGGEYCMSLMPAPMSSLSKMGNASSWFVIILGIWMIGSGMIRTCTHPLWYSCIFTFIGVWFLLGDRGYAPTFGISLLYLMVFILPIGIMVCCSSCKKEVVSQLPQIMPEDDQNKPKIDKTQHISDYNEWENL